MMKFNKINFWLLMLLFLCRFENILGTSDKNIEEGLKGKYKIVDLKGTTLKNEQDEDFSFIVTCKYDGSYYKYSEEIESFIENIKKEEVFDKRSNMEKELGDKSGVSSFGDIVKTQDRKVLVVKDNEEENKVYLVLGTYDKENSKTVNIFLDKNYNLRTSGPYDIKEDNTICILKETVYDCCAEKKNEGNFYKFEIVCCKLEEVKPEGYFKKIVDPSKKFIEQKDDFVEDSGCCDRLCNLWENLCP